MEVTYNIIITILMLLVIAQITRTLNAIIKLQKRLELEEKED